MPKHLKGLFPDDCVDRNLVKRAVHRCLSDSSYYHSCIQQVFLAAGFGVRRVEREPYHPVWKFKLLRGTFELSRDEIEAARQIRRLLKAHGCSVERDAIFVTLNRDFMDGRWAAA
ncbi:MAG: hypothetical protein WBW41_08460 [Verrucomicrobiia bacterium]